MSDNPEANLPLLRMKNIIKSFPGVKALDGVTFELNRGEVHVLIGENGAGKSTLMKVLGGAYQPDEGEIYIAGKKVAIRNPRQGEKLGVSIIYQEFNLVPYLSVAENIFLRQEPVKGKGIKIIDWDSTFDAAHRVLKRLGSGIAPRALIQDLSVGEQQIVEIAKALSLNAHIIVMDEPTASLDSDEISRLFEVVGQLRTEGNAIIYISHRMEEVFRIGDRVTVLRDGKTVGTFPINDTKPDILVELMAKRKISNRYPWEKREIGECLLSVEGLSHGRSFKNVSFTLHRGEILGLAGLSGSGNSEVVRALFGAHPIDAGVIEINGKKVEMSSPRQAIANRICLLPADRKREGLFLGLSVLKNITIASLFKFVRHRMLRLGFERQIVLDYQKKFEIKTPSLDTEAMYLSGGNQQKVMLAKWLCSEADVILFDEPTRGVDVGTKFKIHQTIVELAKEGKGIIMISPELPEILGMSDRTLVIRRGEIVAELAREDATQENVLKHMILS
jgi:ribose transport system ATP-binding protein